MRRWRSADIDAVARHDDFYLFAGSPVFTVHETGTAKMSVKAVESPTGAFMVKPVAPVGVVPPLVGSVPHAPVTVVVSPMVAGADLFTHDGARRTEFDHCQSANQRRHNKRRRQPFLEISHSS